MERKRGGGTYVRAGPAPGGGPRAGAAAVLSRVRLPAVGLLVLGLSTTLVPAFGVQPEGGDLDVFYGEATRLLAGTSFRLIHFQYPPGALGAIVPPALAHPAEHAYAVRFEAAMLVLLATAVVIASTRSARTALLLALAPLLLGPVVLKRFDLLPMLLTLAGLELARRGRWGSCGAALGLGTAVKLYPVLLLPLALIGGGRRALAGFVVACGAVVLPFLVLWPQAVIDGVDEQAARHPQIETPLASAALLAHSIGLGSIGIVSEANSYAVGGRPGDLLAVLTTILLAAALVGVWRRAPVLVRSADGLAHGWAAVLCAAVVLGRVLSPQYLVWLIPFVPAAGLPTTVVLVIALIVTNAWYPSAYLNVVLHMDRGDIVLLVARNLLLVTLLALLLRATERHRGHGETPVAW